MISEKQTKNLIERAVKAKVLELAKNEIRREAEKEVRKWVKNNRELLANTVNNMMVDSIENILDRMKEKINKNGEITWYR